MYRNFEEEWDELLKYYISVNQSPNWNIIAMTAPLYMLEKNKDLIHTDWFSYNKNITLKYVLSHPEIEWKWQFVSANSNITMNDIKNNPQLPWKYESVSMNSNLTTEYVLDNPDLDWAPRNFSYNPGIVLDELFLRLPDSRLLRFDFSNSPSLKIEHILKNISVIWDWNAVSANPSIKLKDIISNPQLPWDWGAIGYNPNLTLEFILKKPHLPWDWYGISTNPNITLKDILKTPNLPWRWIYIISSHRCEKMGKLIKRENDTIKDKISKIQMKFFDNIVNIKRRVGKIKVYRNFSQ